MGWRRRRQPPCPPSHLSSASPRLRTAAPFPTHSIHPPHPPQKKATVHQLGLDLWRDVVVRNRRIRPRLLDMLLGMVQVGRRGVAAHAAGQAGAGSCVRRRHAVLSAAQPRAQWYCVIAANVGQRSDEQLPRARQHHSWATPALSANLSSFVSPPACCSASARGSSLTRP